MKQYLLSSFIYPLMLLMSLTLSSCSGSGEIIPPEPEQPEQPGSNEGDKDESQQKPDSLKINITIGDRVITATMEDHATARDFLSRLPLNVTLNDYAGAEKIFYPDPALTTDGAPRGNASSRGDIDLYIPWGNIAFFYGGDGGYSNSMIHLGKIDGDGAEALDVSGRISMRIERQE